MFPQNGSSATLARPPSPIIELASTGRARGDQIFASRARYLLYTGLGLATIIRLLLTLSVDFPLNDGGMFYVIIRNIQSAHYALPRYSTYNGLHMPFAYPPLAFYATAILADLTHANLLTLLRLLPLILSIAAIGAFALLARSMLQSRDAAAIAVVAFSFLPHTVIWQIMGGGLTRGFGLLFALLAMHQGYELFARRAIWRAAPTAIFASLTILSHPKMAWFLAYSLALFFFWFGRNRNGILGAMVVVSAALVLTSPWWGTVIAYHGIAPYLASIHTGSASLGQLAALALRFDTSGELLFPVLGIIALLGIVSSIQSRQWMLIVWLAIMIPFDPREYQTDMVVPIALLVGIGTIEILIPWLTRIEQTRSTRWRGRLTTFIMTCGLLYLCLGLIVACTSIDVPLSGGDRDAMAWIAHETPSSSQFLVLSGSSGWWTDRQAEWFPALTGRVSIATVQGSEWLSNTPFAEHVAQYNDLQKCADQSVSCLDAWSERTGTSFDYIYVSETTPIDGSRGASSSTPDSTHHYALEFALENDPNYTLVFDNSAAAIFKRN